MKCDRHGSSSQKSPTSSLPPSRLSTSCTYPPADALHRKKKHTFTDSAKSRKEAPPPANVDLLENSECVEEFKHIQNLLSPLKIDVSRKEKMAKALNQIEQLEVPSTPVLER